MPMTLTSIRQAAAKEIFLLPHAIQQMEEEDPRVTRDEIWSVIHQGEIIEDYPADPRGHSCLMLGLGANGRPLHLVVSPKANYLSVITVYVPNPTKWDETFRVRQRR
jgi:hypothetical protein